MRVLPRNVSNHKCISERKNYISCFKLVDFSKTIFEEKFLKLGQVVAVFTCHMALTKETVNPLSPSIIMQILLTGLYILLRTSWENLINHQDSSLSVVYLILMICMCYKGLISWGEIWCWPLLGLKGLNSVLLHASLDLLHHLFPSCARMDHVHVGLLVSALVS